MIDALQQSHAKLTAQVRSLERDRRRHLEMISKLRELVPAHFLSKFDEEYPSSSLSRPNSLEDSQNETENSKT